MGSRPEHIQPLYPGDGVRQPPKNIYDDRYGSHGPGAFADFLVIASFSRKF
jgi:hypothetical protein